ncbi:MAG: HEPN domain-containing protein [Dehalococcoidia bacterium]
MPPGAAKIQLVHNWLTKAHHDLLAAEQLSGNPELLDTALYHCQQAAEKALKGFLVWLDSTPSKTHDLAELVRACESADGSFAVLDPLARTLAPYAVQFRYPDAVLTPRRRTPGRPFVWRGACTNSSRSACPRMLAPDSGVVSSKWAGASLSPAAPSPSHVGAISVIVNTVSDLRCR